MKSSVLLASTFVGAAFLLPKAADIIEAADQQGSGATLYEFMETTRLPTHIHDSQDVTCRFDQVEGKIELTNHTTDERMIMRATEVFPHHYRGEMDGPGAVHVVEEGHIFSGARCYGQQDMPYLPLAIQLRFPQRGL